MSDLSLSVSVPTTFSGSGNNLFTSAPSSTRRRQALLCAVSFTSFCFSMVLLLVSLLIMNNGKEYERLLTRNNVYFMAVAFTIAFGVITLLTGGLGCYCAVSRKLVALVVLEALCSLIAGIELSGGIIVIDHVAKNESLVHMNVLNDTFRNRTVGRAEDLWNDMEVEMNCCGVCGPEDYAELGYNLSLSCCSSHKHAEMNCSVAKAHDKGCFMGLNEYFRAALRSTSIIVICAALLQLFVVGLAFSLARTVWNEYRGYEMNEFADTESTEDKVNRFLNSSRNPEVDETAGLYSSAHSSYGGFSTSDPACTSAVEGDRAKHSVCDVHFTGDESRKSSGSTYVKLREPGDIKEITGFKRVDPGDLEVNESLQRKHSEEDEEEKREHCALEKEDIT